MKLINWCKKNGIKYSTAYQWYREGKIPHSTQIKSGAIFVFDNEDELTQFKEIKPKFQKEWKKEKHKHRMATDPEYAQQCKEYNKANLLKRKEKGYVRGPQKKYADFSPERKAKTKLAATKYRNENKDEINAKAREKRIIKKAEDPLFLEKEREYERKRERHQTPEQKARQLQKGKIWRDQDRAKNPDKYALKAKQRRVNNPEKEKEIRRRAAKKPKRKLYGSLCVRLKKIMKTALTTKKVGGMVNLVGCDAEFLLKHIESQFTPEMNWGNWGAYWQLDHILPLDLSDGDCELATKLNHYTNLRPLHKRENLLKRDKIIPELWPPAFPYPPEDFGLDRSKIPYFCGSSEGLWSGLLSTCWI